MTKGKAVKTNMRGCISIKRKLVALLIGTIVMSTTLTGCEKDGDKKAGQPSKSAVEDNADALNRDGIGGRLGIPAGCNESFDVGASGLEAITIKDSDVSVPDTDGMNIAHMSLVRMDNDEKRRIAETIFDVKEGICKHDSEHMSKQEYQNEIAYYEKQIELAKEGGYGFSYESEMIEKYQEKLAAAPDEYIEAGDYDAKGFVGNYHDMKYLLTLYYFETNMAGGGFNWMRLEPYSDEHSGDLPIRPYEGAEEAFCSIPYEDEVDLENKSTMTAEEAEYIAGKFIDDLGFDNFVKTGTSKLIWNYKDAKAASVATECDGYVIVYKRGIDGVSVYCPGYSMVDNLTPDEIVIGTYCEEFYAYVYDGRVVKADCRTMYQTKEIEKNVDLLSYEEMLEKANAGMAAYYEKYPTHYNKVEFNDVRLTYYMISDDNGEYQYIPAWVFLQYDELQDFDASENPMQIVVMNAMDGTIIDIIEEMKKMECYLENDNG